MKSVLVMALYMINAAHVLTRQLNNKTHVIEKLATTLQQHT